ncbi:MAG: glycoside hydrolase [Caulobacteraceae bacterium]
MLVAAAALAGCAEAPRPSPVVAVAPPPRTLALDPFYRKSVDAGGIPVTASARVPDEALLAAQGIVDGMLERRPDIRRRMVAMGERVGVLAADEMITDLPEERGLKKPALDDQRLTFCERKAYLQIAAMTDKQYWNTRARGLGGLYTIGATENLLGYPGAVYFGENILVHEFSHAMLTAIEQADPGLYRRVEAAYAHARQAGLWKGSYSINTLQEYWAEGVQFWFDSNMAYRRAPSLTVLNHDDLKRYDPMLWSALAQVYSPTHRLTADVFWMSPERINAPLIPEDGHEVC